MSGPATPLTSSFVVQIDGNNDGSYDAVVNSAATINTFGLAAQSGTLATEPPAYHSPHVDFFV